VSTAEPGPLTGGTISPDEVRAFREMLTPER
jgi:hypothetical protein